MNPKVLFCRTKADLVKAYKLLKDAPVLALDTETSNLNPHTNILWSVQLSDGKNSVLVPYHHLKTLGKLGLLLESKLCIAHNMKFDIQQLWARGYDVPNLFCTMVAEQIIKTGFLHYHSFASVNLKDVLKRYFGVELSKEDRKDFYNGALEESVKKNGLKAWTKELIDYAINDVLYLIELSSIQKDLIIKENLQKTLKLEMDVLPVTAKMEYLGILGDYEGMKIFQAKMEVRRDELKPQLIKKLESNWQKYWRREYAKNSALYDKWYSRHRGLITETNGLRDKDNSRKLSSEAKAAREESKALKPFPQRPKEKGELRLSAPQQVRHALEESGIVLSSMRKEVLEDAAGLNPVLDLYLEYKKYEKMAQRNDYELVNSNTGRIHSTFNQIVNTGRYSSSHPNLQNLPSRTDEGKEYRRLIIAPQGRKLVIADFAAIELAIIAKLSKDKVLLEALNSGKDLHCFSMSKVFRGSYDSVLAGKKAKKDSDLDILSLTDLKAAREFFDSTVSIPDVVKTKGLSAWVKQLRDPFFKTITYGKVYGLTPWNFSKKFHCTMEAAEEFFRMFDGVYPSVNAYTERIGNLGLGQGWNSTIGGRKRYYSRLKPPTLDDVEDAVLQKLKEDDRILDSVTDDEWYSMVNTAKKSLFREFKRKEGRIKREAGNHPIQGTSADISKRSMILFEQYITEEGFDWTEGTVLMVHDELLCEVTNEHTEKGAELLEKAMVIAAREYLGDEIRIDVRPLISQFWTK